MKASYKSWSSTSCALITPRWSHDTGWRLLSRSLSSFSPVFLIPGPVLGLSGVLDQWLVLLLNSDSIEILHKCIHQLGLEDQLCKSCQRKSGRGTGCPKKGTNKTNKNGRTWQTCQHSKVIQRGPKGSEMVNLCVFLTIWDPFWAHLDTFGPFQTKINLLPHKDKVGFGGGAFEQKIIFCLKWSKKVQTGQ